MLGRRELGRAMQILKTPNSQWLVVSRAPTGYVHDLCASLTQLINVLFPSSR